jgi:hypothetical protein
VSKCTDIWFSNPAIIQCLLGCEHALKIVNCAHPRQWAWKLLVNWWKIWVLATVFWIKAMTMCIPFICTLVLHISTLCLTMNLSCDTSIARCQMSEDGSSQGLSNLFRLLGKGFSHDYVEVIWSWVPNVCTKVLHCLSHGPDYCISFTETL